MSRPALRLLLAVFSTLLLAVPAARANTSHAGWPQITGMLLMDKQDQPRPLDGRPGYDPFDGTDGQYRCDGLHLNTQCIRTSGLLFTSSSWNCPLDLSNIHLLHRLHFSPLCLEDRVQDNVVPPDIGHNELLGGAADNVIHAGPAGDVIWGYYKPSGAPTGQDNQLYGGPGDDFIYAGHGRNVIYTGGGTDVVHAHFGRGEIHCDSSGVTVYLSHRSRPKYHLYSCRHISYKTLGY